MKTVLKPLGKSTASRATYASALIVFIAITLTILATACSSTSIEEPLSPASTDSDDLVITLSTPETYTFPSSRADETEKHDGHELRYVATLYKSLGGTSPIGINANSTADGEGNRVQRKELLAKNGNQIVFKSIDPGSYFIVVFADYIDEKAELSGGHYTDKYYDTTSSPNFITLLAQNDQKLYFNNDNLDFFIDHSKIIKKEKNIPQEFKIKLTRHVSKVEISAIGGSVDALKEIVINKCFTLPQLDIISGTASAEKTKDMTTGNVHLDMANRDTRLLCYYYTFCSGSTAKALGDTSFELTPNEGYKFANEGEITISSGTIVPKANIIYKVQGAFLNTSQVPSKVVDIKVTTDDKWHDDSQDIAN